MLISAIFVLGVYLVSVLTYKYIYGIIYALLSVLVVNFAFTFPHFKFNFTIAENIVSAIILLFENCGKMMTYTSIIKAIWGTTLQEGSIKKLQVNMANIRKKLGDKPGEANYIANELGIGYRLNE